jgi:hypothetical protein
MSRLCVCPRRLVVALVLAASVAAGGCTLASPTAPVAWCDPRDPRELDWMRELGADPGSVPAPSCQPYPG